jgi:hypothetical protein
LENKETMPEVELIEETNTDGWIQIKGKELQVKVSAYLGGGLVLRNDNDLSIVWLILLFARRS